MIDLFLWIMFIIGSVYIYIALVLTYWQFYHKKTKGIVKQKRKIKRIKRSSFLRSILFDMWKQYALDIMSSDPEFFKEQGLIIFEGRQGTGKTTGMTEQALLLKKMYPKAITLTNLGMPDSVELKHWRQLINLTNEKKGIIVCIDELQNWFSSNQSKDFPPEMLGVVTQNRKNRRLILGTSQNFHMLAKGIRTQTTEVRRCMTILGCLTIILKREPILNSEGDVEKWNNRGFYFFVHTEELRNSFDTWKAVQVLEKSGFQKLERFKTTDSL